jgi:hypothetical protein
MVWELARLADPATAPPEADVSRLDEPNRHGRPTRDEEAQVTRSE